MYSNGLTFWKGTFEDTENQKEENALQSYGEGQRKMWAPRRHRDVISTPQGEKHWLVPNSVTAHFLKCTEGPILQGPASHAFIFLILGMAIFLNLPSLWWKWFPKPCVSFKSGLSGGENKMSAWHTVGWSNLKGTILSNGGLIDPEAGTLNSPHAGTDEGGSLLRCHLPGPAVPSSGLSV